MGTTSKNLSQLLGLAFVQHLSNKRGGMVQGWTTWKVFLSVWMTKRFEGLYSEQPENIPLPFPSLMGSLLTEWDSGGIEHSKKWIRGTKAAAHNEQARKLTTAFKKPRKHNPSCTTTYFLVTERRIRFTTEIQGCICLRSCLSCSYSQTGFSLDNWTTRSLQSWIAKFEGLCSAIKHSDGGQLQGECHRNW